MQLAQISATCCGAEAFSVAVGSVATGWEALRARLSGTMTRDGSVAIPTVEDDVDQNGAAEEEEEVC